MSAMTRGCLAGSAVCFISHKGEVFPCGYLPVVAGNILEADFAAIWRDSSLFARLRSTGQLGGKCGQCEYSKVCAGCRRGPISPAAITWGRSRTVRMCR